MLKSTTHVKVYGHVTCPTLSNEMGTAYLPSPQRKGISPSHPMSKNSFIYLFIFLKIWLLVLELVIISIESIEILQKPVILIIGQTRRSPRLSQEIKILQYSYNSASHSSQVTTHKSQAFTGEVHLVTSECFFPLTVGEIHLIHILIWNFIFSKKKRKKRKRKSP